jgi:hypothetical protein
MAKPAQRPLQIIFFQTTTGKQPVRDWLKELSVPEKKSIGADILSVQ